MNGLTDVCTANGSNQGQNPAVTGLFVPSSLDSGKLVVTRNKQLLRVAVVERLRHVRPCELINAISSLSHRICLSMSLKKSAPPRNRQLIVYYY